MKQHDSQLSEFLRKWQGVEPRPAFEQDVLRRIRLTSPVPRCAGGETGFRVLLRRWWTPVLRPLALTAATAFVAGMLFGLGVIRPVADSATRRDAPTRFQIMQPGTISGNYLTLAEGGQP